MGRNRFAEFLIKASIREISETQLDRPTSGDIDEALTPPATNGTVVMVGLKEIDSDLDAFWSQVRNVSKLTTNLKTDVDKIKSVQSTILTMPIPDERTKSELDELMTIIKTNSLTIRAKLADIKNSSNQIDEAVEESSLARIVNTQHSTLLRNFIEVMNEYQLVQVEYRDDCKARIKRQFEITDTKLSETEIDEMIDQGDFAVFSQGLMVETEQARRILADVEDRHKEFLKLERSLVELHEMFIEMAYLVKSGGDKVDSIAAHVEAEQNCVAGANANLNRAVDIKNKVNPFNYFLRYFNCFNCYLY